jgi:hypothetical protein
LAAALDGVADKLAANARTTYIGCGHRYSTLLMAQAYPASTFTDYDLNPGSIEATRKDRHRS